MEFKKLCRACLTSKDDLYNMFLTATSEMYTHCTSVQVFEDDVLPKNLCHFCYELLHKVYFFKQKCIQSEERLHQYIESSEDVKPNLSENVDDSAIKVEIISELFDSTKKSQENNFNITTTKSEKFEDSLDIVSETLSQNQHNVDEDSLRQECSPDRNTSTNNIFLKTSKVKLKKKKKQKNREIKEFRLRRRKKILEDRKNLNLDYPCLQCNKKFAYPERLEAHKLTHDGVENEIMCHICNKKFKQWDGLRRHREFVHMMSGKSLECPTCGKLYKTTMTLRNHQKIHQERKDFVCHICGGSYRSAGGLQNHVETHRENREKIYECKICNKRFVSNNYLTSHMFRHKERRFVCQVCRFPFFTRADLTRHMLIHNGIKPFVCEICNKAYSTKSFLIEHGRTHSGERPFSCDYCAMNFISKRRLIDHRRTHTGEKPHKCDKCNQAFIQRGSLTRHLKVHEKRRHVEVGGPPPSANVTTQYSLPLLSAKKFNNEAMPCEEGAPQFERL